MSVRTRIDRQHEELRAVLRCLPDDWEGYGETPRVRPDGSWGADCSMDCRWYAKLAGQLGQDWGVCTNPQSHRAGLLTFEHQGCPHHERS